MKNEEINPFRNQLNLLSLKARYRVQELSKNFSSKLNSNKSGIKKENSNKLEYFKKNDMLSKKLMKKSIDEILEFEKICNNRVNSVHEKLEKSKFYIYEYSAQKLPILKNNSSVNLKKKNSCFITPKKICYNNSNSVINDNTDNKSTSDSTQEKNQKKLNKNISCFNIFPQMNINNIKNLKSEKKIKKEKILQFDNINDFIYYKLNNKKFYDELYSFNKKAIKL